MLASLRSIKSQLKDIEVHKSAVAALPRYCPIYDWKKALALATEASEGPGAHRVKLPVCFTAPQTRVAPRCVRTPAKGIDSDPSSLHNQPVEVDVTQFHHASTNPSLFPAGMDKNDFAAVSVTMADGDTRTRVAIIVRFDTAASRLFNRVTVSDVLRVRGMVRATDNPNALSIVVDSVEAIER